MSSSTTSRTTGWLPPPKRFLSWKGRIERRGFIGGCLAVVLAITALGVAGVFFAQPTGLGSFESIDAFALGLMAGSFVPVSALGAQRAHDIGWSAAPVIVVSILVLLFAAVSADIVSGLFGHQLARIGWAVGIGLSSAFLLAQAMLIAALLLFVFLASQKGQPTANRYGAGD
ncbi:MAG: DUF805 domain-containing protein [Hyphomonadaceae bacterium]